MERREKRRERNLSCFGEDSVLDSNGITAEKEKRSRLGAHSPNTDVCIYIRMYACVYMTIPVEYSYPTKRAHSTCQALVYGHTTDRTSSSVMSLVLSHPAVHTKPMVYTVYPIYQSEDRAWVVVSSCLVVYHDANPPLLSTTATFSHPPYRST